MKSHLNALLLAISICAPASAEELSRAEKIRRILSVSTPAPQARTFYRWQSETSGNNLLKAGEYNEKLFHYFMNMQIDDQHFVGGRGVYVAEDIISSSRFVRGDEKGSLIEVRLPKGMPTIDLTDSIVIERLRSIGVSVADAKALDPPVAIRYDEQGWWVFKRREGVRFHPFDSSRFSMKGLIDASREAMSEQARQFLGETVRERINLMKPRLARDAIQYFLNPEVQPFVSEVELSTWLVPTPELIRKFRKLGSKIRLGDLSDTQLAAILEFMKKGRLDEEIPRLLSTLELKPLLFAIRKVYQEEKPPDALVHQVYQKALALRASEPPLREAMEDLSDRWVRQNPGYFLSHPESYQFLSTTGLKSVLARGELRKHLSESRRNNSLRLLTPAERLRFTFSLRFAGEDVSDLELWGYFDWRQKVAGLAKFKNLDDADGWAQVFLKALPSLRAELLSNGVPSEIEGIDPEWLAQRFRGMKAEEVIRTVLTREDVEKAVTAIIRSPGVSEFVHYYSFHRDQLRSAVESLKTLRKAYPDIHHFLTDAEIRQVESLLDSDPKQVTSLYHALKGPAPTGKLADFWGDHRKVVLDSHRLSANTRLGPVEWIAENLESKPQKALELVGHLNAAESLSLKSLVLEKSREPKAGLMHALSLKRFHPAFQDQAFNENLIRQAITSGKLSVKYVLSSILSVPGSAEEVRAFFRYLDPQRLSEADLSGFGPTSLSPLKGVGGNYVELVRHLESVDPMVRDELVNGLAGRLKQEIAEKFPEEYVEALLNIDDVLPDAKLGRRRVLYRLNEWLSRNFADADQLERIKRNVMQHYAAENPRHSGILLNIMELCEEVGWAGRENALATFRRLAQTTPEPYTEREWVNALVTGARRLPRGETWSLSPNGQRALLDAFERRVMDSPRGAVYDMVTLVSGIRNLDRGFVDRVIEVTGTQYYVKDSNELKQLLALRDSLPSNEAASRKTSQLLTEAFDPARRIEDRSDTVKVEPKIQTEVRTGAGPQMKRSVATQGQAAKQNTMAAKGVASAELRLTPSTTKASTRTLHPPGESAGGPTEGSGRRVQPLPVNSAHSKVDSLQKSDRCASLFGRLAKALGFKKVGF